MEGEDDPLGDIDIDHGHGGSRSRRETTPPTKVRGVVRSSPLDYPDALSFSTILLAAAPDELFC
jgi:hypothetical protein